MGYVIDQHHRESRQKALLFSFTIKVNLVLSEEDGAFFFGGDYAISGVVNASGEIEPIGPISGDCEERVPISSGGEIHYWIENWSLLEDSVSCCISVEAFYEGFSKKRRVLLFDAVEYQGELQ